MSFRNSTFSKLIVSYKQWVQANPQLLAETESAVKYLSYFITGRFGSSTLATELIYSMPNLLVLLNDLLLSGGQYVHLKLPKYQIRIKVWLSVLEYTEALLEVTAEKFWGKTGKWLIIAVIQISKTILRLMLVHIYEESMVKNPSLPPLNRQKINEVVEQELELKEGFLLKRTGVVVRSVNTSMPSETRSWAPVSPYTESNESLNTDRIASKKILTLAETLYIIKPLVHLGSLSVTGRKNWKPWLLSFSIDVASLQLFNYYIKKVTLKKEEQEEIIKRRLDLLLYIMRSPFFDEYSRVRILALLDALSRKLPLAKFVVKPLEKYLPHWQQMYFYTWSR